MFDGVLYITKGMIYIKSIIILLYYWLEYRIYKLSWSLLQWFGKEWRRVRWKRIEEI